MSNKRRPRRPTGIIRGQLVTQAADGMPVILPHAEFSFPSDKEAAEKVAMDGLVSQLTHGYVPYVFEKYVRHPQEDGPDFDVVWNSRPAYVELTELAPLRGPYSTAARVFTVGEMAGILDALIRKKNEKYTGRGYSPIFLLVYITDDAFYVAEEVLLVVAHMLQIGSPLIFEAVFFISFWSSGQPHMRMPFPHSNNLLFLDVNRYRDQQVINPDVERSKIIVTDPTTKSITVRQYLPPGTDLSRLVDSVRTQLIGFEDALAQQQATDNASKGK